MKINHTKTSAEKRKLRVRAKVRGTAERPRLHVFRSNHHICLQAIDDQGARTLCAANDIQADLKKAVGKTKTQSAEQVAIKLAKVLVGKNIKQVVFDRGSYRYHGRVRTVADTLRKNGIQV